MLSLSLHLCHSTVEFKPATNTAAAAAVSPSGAVASPLRAATCNTWPSGVSWQTIFSAADSPTLPGVSDDKLYSFGVRFKAGRNGRVAAIRFFKVADEPESTGHVASLYDWATGALLGTTGTFDLSTCTGSQWLSVPLLTGVDILANVEYVAAVDGVLWYSMTNDALTTPRKSGDLATVRSGAVFGEPGRMPVNTDFGAANFWVDGE